MSPYNNYFSIGDHIGTVITEQEYLCLTSMGKIWLTECVMNGIDASRAMGKDLSEYAIEERKYGGEIVADSEAIAIVIANQRGYGERIIGQLVDTIPYDHKMISATTTTKEQLN